MEESRDRRKEEDGAASYKRKQEQQSKGDSLRTCDQPVTRSGGIRWHKNN